MEKDKKDKMPVILYALPVCLLLLWVGPPIYHLCASQWQLALKDIIMGATTLVAFFIYCAVSNNK